MMKKILFYINTIGGGGAERVMVNLANHFAELDYDIVLVTSFPREREYILSEKVKRICLENPEIIQSRIKRNVSRISKLRKICKSEQPDIIVSFMAEPNFRAICATRGLRIKTVVSVRNDPNHEYRGWLGRFIGKHLIPLADGCVFQTDMARNWFPQSLQKRSRIIFNPVKQEFFEVVREPVAGRIVTCGRLEQQKNHVLLIEAFQQIRSEFPRASLEIYGTGKLKDSLQSRIDELGLQERVRLMGTTENVAQILSRADIFVLSSNHEGMPNALMEALAAGVPCISTNCPCGGPEMLIESGENGLLVPVGNPEAMAQALRQLLRDGSFSAKLGQSARERASNYKPEEVYGVWRDYLNSIVGNN